MSLNDLACRNAKPKHNPYKLFDQNGLYLLVKPNGKKYWRLKYYFHDKEKLLALGIYPEVSLLEARNNAENARQDLRNDKDPSFIRDEQKRLEEYMANQTFELVAREWHERNKDEWDEKYAKTILHRLEYYLFPDLGKYPISSMPKTAILACLQKVENSAPVMAKRLLSYISHVCQYAGATERLDGDPTFGLKAVLKKHKTKHFASIEVNELSDLVKAIEQNKPGLKHLSILTLKFMLLTFVRTSELIKATWDEFDFDKALWTVPAERMKMKTVHIVPLSRQAIEILKELKEINGKRKYVFASFMKPRQPISNCTILSALDSLNYKNRMTGHGFRSLAMGVVKEKLRYPHDVIDRQLSHVPKSSVDRAYDRAQYLDERIKMMQEYADYIDKLLYKKEEKNPQTKQITGSPIHSYQTQYSHTLTIRI